MKLTQETFDKIKSYISKGETNNWIAWIGKVSKGTVSKIRKSKTFEEFRDTKCL